MRFKHPQPSTERVIEAITARFDPEHHPDDGQIKKENDVWDFARGKCDGDNSCAARDRPVGRDVEPLAPDHDPAHFATIEMRHRVDVSRIINAPLHGDCRLLVRLRTYLFSCHGYPVNWITGFARIIQ